MSASYEWTEWHLTPDGWVRGSEKTDFDRTTIEPPGQRVLTVRFMDENSGYGAHLSHREEWRSSDEAAVQSLLERFGPAPAAL